MAGKMPRVIVVLLCILHVCYSQPDELTGGATGDNNDQFVDGSANTPKILLGLHCVKETMDATAVTFQFYINQGDPDFKYEASATLIRADQLILYDTCYFIDAAAYDTASKTINRASPHANCDNNVEFTTIDSGAADTTFERRTRTANLTVPDPSKTNDYKCGAMKNGNDIEVAVHCQRDLGYDKAFDVVFIAKYGTGGCTAEMVMPDPVNVADPPTVNVKYNLGVTMKAYTQPTPPATIPVGPESPVANEVTGSVFLGTAIYLEICLYIPQTQPFNNQFFDDGFSYIGISPHTCSVRADIDNQAFQASVESITSWPLFVGSDTCGTAVPGDRGIEEYFPQDTYIFKWVQNTAESRDHLLTPNCFRSIIFPAFSYGRLNAADLVDTIFTCKLDYCTSSTDNRCFGNKAGGPSDYPSCPGTARRKRATISVGPELPEEVSVAIRVISPGANATSSDFDGCFEKKTFIGLTSAMTTLLLAVIVAAIFLAVKLSTTVPETTTDSMTGFQNKGYY